MIPVYDSYDLLFYEELHPSRKLKHILLDYPDTSLHGYFSQIWKDVYLRILVKLALS